MERCIRWSENRSGKTIEYSVRGHSEGGVDTLPVFGHCGGVEPIVKPTLYKGVL